MEQDGMNLHNPQISRPPGRRRISVFGFRRCPAVSIRIFLIGYLVIGLLAFSALAAEEAPADLLTEGQVALEDELFELAQKKTEQYLKTGALTPEDKLAGAILLAQAFHGQKRYQDMLDVLAASRKRAVGTPRAEAFDFWMAMACFELGQWSRALECVRDFEKKYPASPYQPRVLRLQAWSFMKLGKQTEAIDCFDRFAGRYGNSPEGPANLLDGSKALIVAGHGETARDVLEKLMALNLDDRIGQEGRSLLGRIYLSEKKWEQARLIVMPLIDRKNVPDGLRASAFFCLADIAETQSNLVTALSLLDKCSEKVANPALKEEVNLRKGKLLLDMGKIDEGVTLVRGFVSGQTTNTAAREVQIELAQTLLARGLNDKALIEFQNYLETFSAPEGILQAYQGKGWALLNLGRTIEAAASFERAVDAAALPEEKAYCRFKVADCHFAGGQYKLAKESYERVIAQIPESMVAEQALFQVAECRVRLGNLLEAECLFWEVADRDGGGPLAAKALLRVAELRQQQGCEADARAVYRLILAEGDKSARARAVCGLAFLEYRLGRFQEALVGFQNVVQSYSGSDVTDLAACLSGWCYSRLGRYDQALTTFRDFIRQYPRSPWAADVRFWLAEQDYNRRLYGRAETVWVSLAKEYPQASAADKALFWAGRSALKQNEFRRARDHFSLLIKNYPSSERRPDARFYQGEAMCELGEFAGAILIFDEIIRQWPESNLAEAAWFRKGDSQFTLGAEDPKRYEEAVASYQQIVERSKVAELSKMQAEYKIGRCLEKIDRTVEAFERYMKVVYGYFKYPDLKPQGNVWFTRAAFNAAGIKEDEKSWRKATAIYQRIVDARVSASPDAQERINKIRADYWMYFY
ncbi:MAG: tetratricopeptide repeat protein [Verrucomicrobia bacterium]|nr:tetratricopeptide repeat protein [Verrucomicrobiota bacterium]MBU4290456.1 tetratricopeptide repeat protein [Verrucomicrobiota bacterium]MBU4430060.1 tetratricopeptide repeat protein [Verrucomicrobiota bacterium]MCG2681113.1 tetratricopeptide repeat protein [Kiritimatiellia bacterium]